jgi:hypothetical protein
MSGVAIIRNLLANNASLLLQVPDTRIYAGVLPENVVLPAISVLEVVATEIPHIDGSAPTTIVEAHVQVTVIAASYALLKQVHALARKACNYQHGSIDGFSVVHVRRLSNGPDMSDVSAKFCMQSIDFSVIYHEPNT